MLARRLTNPTPFILFLLANGLFLMSGCDVLAPPKLTITWTTESELDIIGFNLYRAESPDGPFVQINSNLIPPAADPFLGGSYEFVDEGVQRGVTYYYQLETVDRYGGRSRTEPITLKAGNS